MPVNTSLYNLLQPPPIQNPLEAVTQVLQGQKMASELRILRQQQADQAAIRQVLTETEGDIEKALPRLRQIAPSAALGLETEIAKHRKELALGHKAQTEAEIERTKRTLQLFPGVTEQTYPDFYANLQKSDPEVAGLLTPTWDTDRFSQVHRIGLTTKEALERQERAFTLAAGNNPTEALSTYFSTLENEAEWNEGLEKWRQLGTPRELLAMVGPWDPGAPKRIAQRGLTPAKRAELAGQADTRAQTAAHNAATEAIARGQLAVSQGQLGVARAREAREAATPRGAKASEGERKAAGFHGQMQQALTTINELESKLTSRDIYQIQSLPQEGFMGALNRSNMSDNAKRYIQAFNQFTEARLRPVSGAAIADSEYARDRATYAKQYGETTDLATQRQAARGQALDALRTMAGSALDDAPPPPRVPDLTGLPKGRGRKFTSGPFAGQTWALDDNGKPYKVQ